MKVRVAAAVAVVVTGVTASSAMGAVLVSVPDRACLREGETAAFVGTGFQPGQPVALSADGQQLPGTLTADPLGRVGFTVTPPGIPSSEKVRALTVTQVSNTALTATKTFTETKLYVATKPNSFRPGRRLKIRAGGFYGAGGTLYAHVRGPDRRNLRIGRITGACGKVSARRKTILKKGDSPGTYIVQYDTVRKFRGRRTKLQFREGYTIRRFLRFSRTSSFSSPVFGDPSGWRPTAG